jgi:hypothetical protein
MRWEDFIMTDIKISFPSPCSENWDDMAPAGCNRHCASCDQTIFDLREYTLDQAEALMRSSDHLCVRAELDAAGAVKFKSSAKPSKRRMIASIGAAIGLVTAPTLAAAKDEKPQEQKVSAKKKASKKVEYTGKIAGKVDAVGYDSKVTAWENSSNPRGKTKTYKGKVNPDGTYEISGLPDGSYAVFFEAKIFPRCSGYWRLDNIIVRQGQTATANARDDMGDESGGAGCPIIVGQVHVKQAMG